MKVFFWYDLTGGGRNGLVSENSLPEKALPFDFGTMPPFYNDEISLYRFITECKQGDEWYNATDCYLCIGTIEDIKNQLHI